MDPSEDREPNPEAIAWYLSRSERLLDDLKERVQLLLARCGQLAGFSGAVLALVGGTAASIIEAVHGGARRVVGAALLIGSLALVAAFVTALSGISGQRDVADISAREAVNYLFPRFTTERDLWRVQLRTIKGVVAAIEATTHQVDAVDRAANWAGRFLLGGLAAVGTALGILMIVVTLR